jgi:tetratricopeptide (TPR) repeat protein
MTRPRITVLSKFAVLIIFCLFTSASRPCTIFIANNGKNVWIGNNEDELSNINYRFWFYPSEKNNKYTSGYVIWTELNGNKFLDDLSYLNPQGGLNEYGLFMDYTAIDEIPIVKDPEKEDRKNQVVTDILKECKTVKDALRYISKYNLISLNSAQLFIGDKTGDYAIVTGGYIINKTVPSFAVTNYCINNGYKEACHRRDVATSCLTKTRNFNLKTVASILEKSAAKKPNNLISNYSMAIDLKTLTINLFLKGDYTTLSAISLREELKSEKHQRDLTSYFPEDISFILQNEYKANGIDAAISKYDELKNSFTKKYNFKNDSVLRIAISWIDAGNTKDAINFLQHLVKYNYQNPDLYNWIAIAYRKENNIEKSDYYFKKVLKKNPSDYLANLYGRQANQKIVFKLPDFEGAENVFLIGKFTEWEKNPIKMVKHKDYWTCEVTLPKGEINYKFMVNSQYLADSKNYLHVGEGPETYSKLYVW